MNSYSQYLRLNAGDSTFSPPIQGISVRDSLWSLEGLQPRALAVLVSQKSLSKFSRRLTWVAQIIMHEQRLYYTSE